MHDQNGSMGRKPKPYPPRQTSITQPPYAGQVPFRSRGGQKFLAIAKNKAWGNKQDDSKGPKVHAKTPHKPADLRSKPSR
jgi:hypothetical protein